MTVQIQIITFILFAPAIVLVTAQSSSCGGSVPVNNAQKSHRLTYHGGTKSQALPANASCSWELKVETEAYIQATDFYLADKDNLTVFDSKNNSLPLFGPFRGRQGPFVFVLGNGTFTLKLQSSGEDYPRSFLLDVKNQCMAESVGLYSFNSAPHPGVIRSPMYSSLQKDSFTCTIHISGYGVANKPEILSVSVVDFNISDGHMSVDDKKTGPVGQYDFVNLKPQPLFLTKSQLQLVLTINTRIPNQFVVIEYEIVSECCSKVVNLTGSNSTAVVSLTVQDEIVWFPLVCHWLVAGPPNTQIHTSSSILHLKDMQDTFLISGPADTKFKQILVTSDEHKYTEVDNQVVQANYLILKFTSLRPRKGTLVSINVSLNSTELNVHENKGVLNLSHKSAEEPPLNLKVAEDEYLKLTWSAPLPEGAILSLYKNFDTNADPFFELTRDYLIQSLTLPFHRTKLVVRKFPPESSWLLNFEGVDSDCDQIMKGDKMRFQLDKDCIYTNCTWIVPPSSKQGVYEVSFTELVLDQDAHVNLYKTGSSTQPIATYNKNNFNHVIEIPSEIGLYMKVFRECSHEPSIVKASVLYKPACIHSHTISVGESISVQSPGFPMPYPLNSYCLWQLATPAKFLALWFNQVSLSSPGSHIKISAKDKVVSITGSAASSLLPNDALLVAPVELSFKAPLTSLNVPSGFGFLLTATAFDCGGIVTAARGKLSLPTESRFCMWSISVPRQNNSITQLHLQVDQAFRRHVQLFDGGSIRNSLLTLNGQGTAYSSGPSVMIIYRSDESNDQQTSFLQYSSAYCDSSSTCRTGQCLWPEWRCNGRNDCGDNSDEEGCSIHHTLEPLLPCISISSTKPSSVLHTTASETTEDGKVLPGDPSPASSVHSSREGGHTSPLIVSLGSALGGVVLGILVTFLLLKQFRKKRKQWKSLRDSNTTVDNVSL